MGNKRVIWRRFWGLLSALLLACPVMAQNVQDMQKRGQQLQKEIDALQQRIEEAGGNLEGQVNQYRMGQRLLSSRQKLITGIEGEIASYNDRIVAKNKAIQDLSVQHEQLMDSYQLLLQKAYSHRDKKLWFMHVLASEDFSQAYRRWRYFKSYGDYMRNQVKRIQATEEQLKAEKEALQQLQAERVVLRAEREQEVSKMKQDQQKLDNGIKKLQKNQKQLKAELQKRQKEQNVLNNQIQKAIADAAQKKAKTESAAQKQASRVLSADFAKNKGKLPWPLDNALVIEAFGSTLGPQSKLKNKGVVLSAEEGATVKSVFNGTVSKVWFSNIDSYLWRVLVSHGDYYTIYCHMAKVNVKAGDTVTTGQALGTLAPGGVCYFQLSTADAPLDPEMWFTR